MLLLERLLCQRSAAAHCKGEHWWAPSNPIEPSPGCAHRHLISTLFSRRFAFFSVSVSEIPTPPPPAVLFKRIQSSAVVVEPSTPFLPLKSPLQFPQRSSSVFHTLVLLGRGGGITHEGKWAPRTTASPTKVIFLVEKSMNHCKSQSGLNRDILLITVC